MFKQVAVLFAAMILGSCGGGRDDAPPAPVQLPPTDVGTKPPPPSPTQQFVDQARAGSGTIDLVGPQDTVIFSGCLKKNKTEEARTVGAAAFLTNRTSSEYRLVDFSYTMNTSGLRAGETVETDVGFTVLPRSEVVALNSGEELMITHLYDAAPGDRGVQTLTIPRGGFAIAPDQRLSIGSVSAIFPTDGSGAKLIEDSRLADGSLFEVCYSATVKRADTVADKAIVSYRSAFRDRSYVADPARTTAPFTSFRNTSNEPVRIHGIGSFLSNLSSSEFSSHSVEALVDGKLVSSIALPDHVPGRSSTAMPMVHPVSIVVNPGETLTVKGRVIAKRAIVFDYAAFIFADRGLVSVDEKLDMLQVDFNGDGYNDIVDLDSTGSFWVSIRVGQGLQNTQQEWARAIRHVDSLSVLPRSGSVAPIILRATNMLGLCLNMTAMPEVAQFRLDYCQSTASPTLESDVWGDYNGDGFIDRLRVDAAARVYRVALGSAQGLEPERDWLGGFGAVEKMFVSDADNDGSNDVMAEWTDAAGLQCRILYGAGDRFRVGAC